MAGQIIVLNGTPRAGKSSIAQAIQESFDGVWMNLGLEKFKKGDTRATPARHRASTPGCERPDLEPLVQTLYRAMYRSIAAHSRLGMNVVVDTTHHDEYADPLGILPDCARVVADLRVLFVGVRCPLEVIMQRRITTWARATRRWLDSATGEAMAARRSHGPCI